MIKVLTLFSLILFYLTNSFAIDVSLDDSQKKEISPYIYGMNQTAPSDVNINAMRYGGNRITGYNWENNTSNAGSDWKQSSDYYLVSSAGISSSQQDEPGICLTNFIDNANIRNAYALVTLPMAGYVTKDANGTVTESETAPSDRWVEVKPFKGSALSLTPDLNDNYVYVDEEVNFLANKYGKYNQTSGLKGFALDNEPGLWSNTHPRIHPDTLKCSELLSKSFETSKAVKSISMDYEVFGPALFGWSAFASLQGNSGFDVINKDGKYDWFIDYYLEQMKNESEKTGYRLLDVLDVHWYHETSEDLNFRPGFNDASTDDERNYVMNAPRSLYDSTYVEGTWISHWMTRGPVYLANRLRNSVNKYYPGTKIAITEYNYGSGGDFSSAVATADFLGGAAKEGIYFTSHWGDIKDYVASGFKLYTNYDNQGSTFGKYYINNNLANYNDIVFHSSINDDGQIHIITASRDITKDQTLAITLPSNDTYKNYYVWKVTSTNKDVEFDVNDSVINNTINFTLKKGELYHIVVNNANTTSATKDKLNKSIKMTTYPNPFNPTVNININTYKNGKLFIYNINGKKVAEKDFQKSGNYVWNAQNYASGVYFAKFVINNRNIITKKLILMK